MHKVCPNWKDRRILHYQCHPISLPFAFLSSQFPLTILRLLYKRLEHRLDSLLPRRWNMFFLNVGTNLRLHGITTQKTTIRILLSLIWSHIPCLHFALTKDLAHLPTPECTDTVVADSCTILQPEFNTSEGAGGQLLPLQNSCEQVSWCVRASFVCFCEHNKKERLHHATHGTVSTKSCVLHHVQRVVEKLGHPIKRYVIRLWVS
jgi:hypothetical protein